MTDRVSFEEGELFVYVRDDPAQAKLLRAIEQLRSLADELDDGSWLGREDAVELDDIVSTLESIAIAPHLELGQVREQVDGNSYRCWYSKGNTAALTDVRNMRKLANAGCAHVLAQAAPAVVEEGDYLYQMDGSGQWWCYSHHSAFGPFDTLDSARRRMAERA